MPLRAPGCSAAKPSQPTPQHTPQLALPLSRGKLDFMSTYECCSRANVETRRLPTPAKSLASGPASLAKWTLEIISRTCPPTPAWYRHSLKPHSQVLLDRLMSSWTQRLGFKAFHTPFACKRGCLGVLYFPVHWKFLLTRSPAPDRGILIRETH